MCIRKTLTRLLITAMVAGSICFPVPADEIDISTAQQAVLTEQDESESESSLPDEVVIETESESEVEPETGAMVDPETETTFSEDAVSETETIETSDPETDAVKPEEALTETGIAADVTFDIQEETESETQTALETETSEDEAAPEEAVLLGAVTPRAATNFKAVPSDTYVTLSWTRGANAKGCRIEMHDVSANKTSWITATEKTTYKITGLKPNQSYKFRLLAWTGTSPNFTFGEYTSWISVKTTAPKPGTPSGLKATRSGTSAKVSWTAGKNAQKYRVRIYDVSTKASSFCAFTNATSVTVNGLISSHTYKFRVQAYSITDGVYTFSDYTPWIVSNALTVTPGAPSGLTALPGDKSVKLSWTAGKNAQKYRVRIYDCVSKESSWAVFTSATSVNITGLKNNHDYKFRVQAYCKNSDIYTYSSYTPWVAITVSPLADAKAIGWNNSVIICWPKVANATLYRIYSVNLSTGTKTWVKSFVSSYTEYRIDKLKNGTTYAYYVYAYKDDAVYAHSQLLKATAAEPRSKYVSTALAYLGAKEGSALHKEIINIYNSQNPVPVGYKMTYTDPWCAAFATAMAVKANVIRMIPGECSCTRQIALWKKLGYYVSDPGANKKYTPSVGDLVYYSWTKNASSPDHVGIVTKVTSTTLTVIEGNKGNAVSERVINDYKHYGYIIGYGKPNGN